MRLDGSMRKRFHPIRVTIVAGDPIRASILRNGDIVEAMRVGRVRIDDGAKRSRVDIVRRRIVMKGKGITLDVSVMEIGDK